MKFIQYSISLPITIEEYALAESYMYFMVDYDIFSNDREHFEFIMRKGYSDSEYKNAVLSQKHYYLNNFLTETVYGALGKRSLLIEENKISAYPKTKCLYRCPSFPKFQLEVYSHALPGDNPVKSPFSLNREFDVEFIELDPVCEKMAFFKEYEEKIVRNFQESYNISNTANWKKNRTQFITVYKLAKLSADYQDYKAEIEYFLSSVILRSYLLYFYKSMLIIKSSWINLTLGKIDKLYDDLKNKTTNQKMDSFRVFNTLINDSQDMISKTSYLLFRDRMLQESQFQMTSNQETTRKTNFIMSPAPNTREASEIFDSGRIGKQSPIPHGIKGSFASPSDKLGLSGQGGSQSHYDRRAMSMGDNIRSFNSNLEPNDFTSYNNNLADKSPSNYRGVYNVLKKKTGTIYKKGDGPIDFNWNSRYVVLDGQSLMYFKYASERTPRGVIKLNGAQVSTLFRHEERDNVFSIDTQNPPRKYFFSGENKEESEIWRLEIFKASGYIHPQEQLLKDAQDQTKSLYRSTENMKDLAVSKNQNLKGSINLHQLDNVEIAESKFKSSSVIRSTVPTRTLQKKKSLVCADDYKLKNFPGELYPFQGIQQNFSQNLSKNWSVIKFCNSVKIFKNITKKPKKSFFLSKFLFLALLVAIAAYSYQTYEFLQLNQGAVLGVASFLFLIFAHILFLRKSADDIELLGKITLDEDASKVFQRLKSARLKKKWDINILSIEKIKSASTVKYKRVFNVCFEIQKIAGSYFKKNSQKLNLNLTRYCFLDEEREIYFIVEVMTQKKNIEITEIISIERLPKISGKSNITFYSRVVSTSVKVEDIRKLLMGRMKRLALIREFMSEERLEELGKNLDLDEELSEVDEKDLPDHKPAKNSILSHELSLLSPKNKVEDNVPRVSFEEQISNVEKLKQGEKSNSTRKPIDERKPGYRRVKEGGLECFHREELKCQEGIVLDLMKSAGKQLMEGKNVVGVSLPVRIFEPRSTIERICDWWAFGPVYLTKASQVNDSLERFKNVISFAVSGLYNGCKQLKPFNPILGETFQAFWPDGTEIYVEHTSHHPPISNFLIRDFNKKYEYWGHYEYKASLKGNSVAGRQQGANIIRFEDTGEEISYDLPPCRISGLLFGARVIEWFGGITFTNQKKDLQAKITFYERGLFAKQHSSDHFEGTIYKLSEPTQVLSKISGSWLDNIEFDGKRYWDIEVVEPANLIRTNDPLPSDCRYREDLLWLAKKDLVKSQEHKIRLEVIQRTDRKLRHEHHSRKK